jgi:hypothetical protein
MYKSVQQRFLFGSNTVACTFTSCACMPMMPWPEPEKQHVYALHVRGEGDQLYSGCRVCQCVNLSRHLVYIMAYTLAGPRTSHTIGYACHEEVLTLHI